jgi:hypothetical protein
MNPNLIFYYSDFLPVQLYVQLTSISFGEMLTWLGHGPLCKYTSLCTVLINYGYTTYHDMFPGEN